LEWSDIIQIVSKGPIDNIKAQSTQLHLNYFVKIQFWELKIIQITWGQLFKQFSAKPKYEMFGYW